MKVCWNFSDALKPGLSVIYFKQRMRDENGGKLPRNWRRRLNAYLEGLRAMAMEDDE